MRLFKTIANRFLLKSKPARASVLVERSPRVKLVYPSNISFWIGENTSEPVQVVNLSTSGIGLSRKSIDTVPEKSSVHVAILKIREQRFSVSIRVARLSSDVVGCAFVESARSLVDAITELFRFELQAARLIEVNREILKEELDGKPRLFRGGECELFWVEDSNSKIVRAQLSFLGNYFEAGVGEPLRFGYLESQGEREKPKMAGSSIVRFASSIPAEMSQAALAFVKNVSGLSQDEQEQLERLFSL